MPIQRDLTIRTAAVILVLVATASFTTGGSDLEVVTLSRKSSEKPTREAASDSISNSMREDTMSPDSALGSNYSQVFNDTQTPGVGFSWFQHIVSVSPIIVVLILNVSSSWMSTTELAALIEAQRKLNTELAALKAQVQQLAALIEAQKKLNIQRAALIVAQAG